MANRFLITGGSSVVWNASNTAIWSETSGGATGASVPGASDDVIMDADSGGGKVTLGYAPTVRSITGGSFTGELDFFSYSPICNIDYAGTGARTLTLGSGQINLNGVGAKFETNLNPTLAQGGVERVIDSATGDIARTTAGWIEDEKYGVYAVSDASTVSLEFDSTEARTGRLVVGIVTSGASARGRFVIGLGGATSASVSPSLLYKHSIPVKPSTTYKLSSYFKFVNLVSTNSIIVVQEFTKATGSRVATNATTASVGDSDGYIEKTITFTTNASTDCVVLAGGAVNAGDAQEVYFDINSMTLEEVSTITNSGSSPALLYPKFTAVSSTDNIDQSQVVGAGGTGTMRLGDNGNNSRRAQSIVFSKKNLTGITIQKQANVGSPVFDVKVSVQADSSGSPSGTDLGTPVTYTAAQWDAITNATDFTVPYVLTVTPTATYWVVFTPSAQGDASNYRTIVISGATNPYPAGGLKGYDGSAWRPLDTSYDMVFKTLYSKNTTNVTARTDTQELSITAPTVDGWANGTVIDTADGTYGVTPLTLAPGDNTVYVSSNGPATADEETDPSHQCIFAGGYGSKVPFDLSTTTNLTFNKGTANIKITDGDGLDLDYTFKGGSQTYNDIWFSRGTSTGSNILTGSNNFEDIKDNGSVAHSFLLTAGTTTGFKTWNINGSSAGSRITLSSTTAATHTWKNNGTATPVANYLDISYSIAS